MAAEIRYINSAGGGFNERRLIEDGTTVEQFFARVMPSEDREQFNVRVNNGVPVQGQVLRNGDLVSIIPGNYDGGVALPAMRDIKKFMAHLGYCYNRRGKGDHEIWVSSTGQSIALNRSKRDPKTVDMGSFRDLADQMGCNLGEALDRVSEWLKRPRR
jgi:hypothetical protein